MQREIFLIVQKQCKTVLFALPTGLIHLQPVAELALQKGWFEGGADWEGDVGKPNFGFRDDETGLVRAKGDERRVPSPKQMRRVSTLFQT